MRRYIGMAAGVGLIVAVLSAAGTPAAAQAVFKPLLAQIINDVSNPVPVVVTNTPPPQREPFQVGSVPTSYAGSSASRALVTVPDGKRLVIEHASAWINSGTDGGLLNASLFTSNSASNQLACSRIGQNALNFVHACSGPTLQYVTAGQELSFGFSTFGTTGGFYRIFVVGYFETVP